MKNRMHYEALLAPSEVSEITGVSPEMQRDWRRRGLMDDLGEVTNSRWRYSVHDAFTLWIVRKLTESGIALVDAMDPASLAASDLLKDENIFLVARKKHQELLSKHASGADTTVVTRYMTLYRDNEEWGYTSMDDLSLLQKFGWPVAFVIDIWHLAATAPNALVKEAFPEL